MLLKRKKPGGGGRYFRSEIVRTERDEHGFFDFKLFVREEGRDLPITRDCLFTLSERAFAATGASPGDISLLVCGDPFISELNEQYLGTAGPTDVLAFPLREGERPRIPHHPLGDIVISCDAAEQEASSGGSSVAEEFIFLFVHGLLHLLGYIHDSLEDRRRMDELAYEIISGVATNP